MRRTRRTSPQLATVGALCAATIIGMSLVLFIRFMSPTNWMRITTSPHVLRATIIAYREVSRLSPHRVQLWDYEVALDSAPRGQVHVIYLPRMRVDNRLKNPRYPGRDIRVSPAVETHVFIDDTLKVSRAYLAD